MSNVLVKRPTDQITEWVSWSVGRLTDAFDNAHGTSQHLTSASEYVLQRELQDSWLVRTADLAERIVGQRTVWILRPEAVCQIESFRSKLHPLTLAYLEGSRQGNVE